MILFCIIICFAAFTFINKPLKALIFLAVFVAIWIEYKFEAIYGIRIGFIDVVLIGGTFGILRVSNFNIVENKDHEHELKRFVYLYIIISIIVFSFNHNIFAMGAIKLTWALYKEIYIACLFFLCFYLIKEKSVIEKVINGILLSAGFSSIIGILQVFTQSIKILMPFGVYGDVLAGRTYVFYKDGSLRAFGTLWHPNDFGGFLILTLSISISIYIFDKNYKYKKYLLLNIVAESLALILTYSRGAWAGFSVSIVVLYYFARKYIKINLWVIIIVIAVICTFVKFAMPKIDLIPGNISNRFFSLSNAEDDIAMVPRYKRWNYFLEKSLRRPIVGYGVIVSDTEKELFEDDAPTPHSTYIYLAIKRGYVALTVFIIILIKCVRISYSLYKQSNDYFLKGIAIGIISGIIGLFGVAANFGSFMEDVQVSVLFWILYAISCSGYMLTHSCQKTVFK